MIITTSQIKIPLISKTKQRKGGYSLILCTKKVSVFFIIMSLLYLLFEFFYVQIVKIQINKLVSYN